MDIVDRLAHELIEQSLAIHRKAYDPTAEFSVVDQAKVGKLLLDLKLQPLCEEHKIERSKAVIRRVKEMLRSMPVRCEVEVLLTRILTDLIKTVFRTAGLDW